MEYLKPARTYVEQADLLIKRGLICSRDELIGRLVSVSYYRLSGYLYPFRLPDDTFKPNTTLAAVWMRYTFDRQLRLLVLDAIERVEICVRSELVYRLAHAQGAFGYTDPKNLPGLSPAQHAKFLKDLSKECGRSKETFISHFTGKYGDKHSLPPYWMVTELMTFGALFTLFRGSPKPIKQAIAGRFGVADTVLENWLNALNTVRNTCAHHGRLWNRELGIKPMIPRKDKQWHDPVEVSGDRVFGILTVLKYLLDEIAPQSRWPSRLEALLRRYAEIPRIPMGYPVGWESCPIWSRPTAVSPKSLVIPAFRRKPASKSGGVDVE